MIIKKIDLKQEEMAELTALLKGRLIPYQRFLIERELKTMKSGFYGNGENTGRIS
jgi:ATP sulfurylase